MPETFRSPIDPESDWTVWGQRSAVSELRQAAQRGPGHAYIFSGPAQSGRRAAALEFASGLCCPNAGSSAVPCRTCAVCRRIGRGVFPDVSLFDLESQAARDRDKSKNLTLNISTVREVSSAVAYRPAEASWRIVVVDDVETMQETAQEAFLKTLEEPPPFVVLIMIATDLDTLLPTILSRCRVVRFGVSSSADVESALTAAQVPPDRAAHIAGVAEGSMGWAFDSANDETLVESREAAVSGAIEFVLSDGYQRLVRAIHLADEFGRGRDEVFSRLQVIQGVWRTALYMGEGVEASAGNALVASRLASVQNRPTGDLVRAIRSVDTCIANLESNVRPRLALESMVLAWPRLVD